MSNVSHNPQNLDTTIENKPSRWMRWAANLANPRGRQNVLAIGDQAIISGTNFLTTIVVGRWCGPEGLGIFGLGLTLIFLLVATQESLITTPYTIFLARTDDSNKPTYRANTLLSYLVMSALCATVLLTAAVAMLMLGASQQIAYVLAALALACPCWLLREFARRSAYAEFKIATSFGINVTVMVAQVVGLVCLARLDRLTPASGFLVVAIANLIAGVAWVFTSRNSMKFSRGHFRTTLSKHWGLGKVMFVSQVIHAMSSLTLPWLIAFCLGTTATGVFVACEQIIRLSNPLLVGLTNILTPRTAHTFAEEGRAGVHHIVKRAMILFAIPMALFCGAIALCGDQILGRLFGDEYLGYSTVLIILVAAKAFDAVSIGPGRGLIVFERVNDCLRADVIKFCITLTTTLILIWQFDILGAAFGTLIGSIVFTTILTGLYWKAAVLPAQLPVEATQLG